MSRRGVRIAGGVFKGARLRVPAGVRPTGQRVREALCSRWQNRLTDAVVLDLFAGSGAVGFEAVSRGAASALLIEADPAVFRQLRAAAERLGTESVKLRRARLPEGLAAAAGKPPFDLVFADPPYAFDGWSALLEAIAACLAPDGEAVLEHSSRVELPSCVAGLECVETRRYGDSALSFYRPGLGSGSDSPGTLRK